MQRIKYKLSKLQFLLFQTVLTQIIIAKTIFFISQGLNSFVFMEYYIFLLKRTIAFLEIATKNGC